MYKFDGFRSMIISCLFPNRDDDLRLKINCKCKTVFYVEIPRLLVEQAEGIPVIACENCERHYVYYNHKITRLRDFKVLDALVPEEFRNYGSWLKGAKSGNHPSTSENKKSKATQANSTSQTKETETWRS